MPRRTRPVPSIRLERVYEPPAASGGCRILVERLWPRGVSRAAAKIDWWAKEVAPSSELRRWYGHEPKRFAEFRRRYRAELRARPEALAELEQRIAAGPVTFVFSSRETRLNNAVVLKEYLEERARSD